MISIIILPSLFHLITSLPFKMSCDVTLILPFLFYKSINLVSVVKRWKARLYFIFPSLYKRGYIILYQSGKPSGAPTM